MKIKTDFVTNSSSIGYVLEVSKDFDVIDLLYRNGITLNRVDDDSYECSDVEELISYAQGEPCDWVDKVRGPRDWYHLGPTIYEACEKAINNDNKAVYISISRNYWDRVEHFLKILRDNKIPIIEEVSQ